MDVEEVKLYLRLDTEDEDTLILELIAAAEMYLENSGVFPDYTNPQYKLAVKMLVAEYFDERTLNGTMGMMFKSIICQLVASQKKGGINGTFKSFKE